MWFFKEQKVDRSTDKSYLRLYRHGLFPEYYGSNRVGCLYMGDYDASGVDEWNDLEMAYGKYWENVGCIQIPHHGSTYNYNPKLAAYDVYYIISAGLYNSHRHPHSRVIRDLLFKGHFPFVVTEERMSEVDFVIRLL